MQVPLSIIQKVLKQNPVTVYIVNCHTKTNRATISYLDEILKNDKLKNGFVTTTYPAHLTIVTINPFL